MTEPTSDRYQSAAASHPSPNTPGLQITERDPELACLYDDCKSGQLTLRQLEALGEEKLLWLAGHLDAPPNIQPAEWAKLNANAWRARFVVERRMQQDFQRAQNRWNRLFGILGVAVGVILGFGLPRLWPRESGDVPSEPVRVEVVSPTSSP